jgi:hypothetical protein
MGIDFNFAAERLKTIHGPFGKALKTQKGLAIIFVHYNNYAGGYMICLRTWSKKNANP